MKSPRKKVTEFDLVKILTKYQKTIIEMMKWLRFSLPLSMAILQQDSMKIAEAFITVNGTLYVDQLKELAPIHSSANQRGLNAGRCSGTLHNRKKQGRSGQPLDRDRMACTLARSQLAGILFLGISPETSLHSNPSAIADVIDVSSLHLKAAKMWCKILPQMYQRGLGLEWRSMVAVSSILRRIAPKDKWLKMGYKHKNTLLENNLVNHYASFFLLESFF